MPKEVAQIKARRFAAVLLYNRGRSQSARSLSVHETEKAAQEAVSEALRDYSSSRGTTYIGAIYELKGVLRYKPVPLEYVTGESQ